MSITVDPTVPQDSENESLGASRIRALAGWLNAMFGQSTSSAFTFNNAPFAVDANGNVVFSQNCTLKGDPSTALQAATKQYVDKFAAAAFVATATGTNTYAITLSPAPANLAALTGYPLTVIFTNGNTGAATLNPNTLGATAISKWIGGNLVALVSGDIPTGAAATLVYDGTQFQLISIAFPDYRIYKSSDQSVNNSTTLVNDSALLFAVPANQTWQFEAMILDSIGVDGSQNYPGLKAAFTVPTGATLDWGVVVGAKNGRISGSGTPFTVFGPLGLATASSDLVVIQGRVANGANAGNCQFQFAQSMAQVANTTVLTGSVLRAWRVA